MELTFWHWWTIALLCLALEAFLPGALFLGIAVAASLVGLLLVFIPLSIQFQLLLLSLFAIASMVLGRLYLYKNPIQSEQPLLNQRQAQFIGRVCKLEKAIINGRGRVKLDDSFWRVRGEDLPVDTVVKITGIQDTDLVVERMDE
ncbi:NfeD family protein [Candidatus Venteria ishoeyi]|uniref:Inner membrane protein YbbJ n=1 Tax=Candidatus Venteria ishoeyi TaxID=1899563 RepID=A0A1H6FDU7_9GAMM|nr:NfeD family protein [Candidatus Venteria ishoeyi]MDM8547113.1 NfeD family protein [Candidatus Venteria ishoeyi]SEH08260.1 Inner membrane protein YbbJ [Candidatus Venteria ishoeyi]